MSTNYRVKLVVKVSMPSATRDEPGRLRLVRREREEKEARDQQNKWAPWQHSLIS